MKCPEFRALKIIAILQIWNFNNVSKTDKVWILNKFSKVKKSWKSKEGLVGACELFKKFVENTEWFPCRYEKGKLQFFFSLPICDTYQKSVYKKYICQGMDF